MLAQWLITNKLEAEQETIVFDQAISKLLGEPGQKKTKEGFITTKKTPFLIRLLTVGMVAAVVVMALMLWLSQPPTRQVGHLPVIDPNYSASNTTITIVQYAHAPGFLGKWQQQDQYRWPKDTLFLYGETLGHPLPDSSRLDPINESGQYHLVIRKRTYLIHVGQTKLTPLTADETP